MLATNAAERVQDALHQLGQGRQIVLVDDLAGSNSGHLVFAAECATPLLVSFMVRHTSGFVCVALPDSDCGRLDLPEMRAAPSGGVGPPFRVTVDRVDVGTGISAASRASTIAALGSPRSRAEDFQRPGHVVPAHAALGGLLARTGIAEAAVDLARLAGRSPAAAYCGVVSPEQPTEMAVGEELMHFAALYEVAVVSMSDLVTYRRALNSRITREPSRRSTQALLGLESVGYRESGNGMRHVALVSGHVADRPEVFVHVHLACPIGELFEACHCGEMLSSALAKVAARDPAVLAYVRPFFNPSQCVRDDHFYEQNRAAAVEIAEGILNDLKVGSAQIDFTDQMVSAGAPTMPLGENETERCAIRFT